MPCVENNTVIDKTIRRSKIKEKEKENYDLNSTYDSCRSLNTDNSIGDIVEFDNHFYNGCRLVQYHGRYHDYKNIRYGLC
jgi:hypothetical protein